MPGRQVPVSKSKIELYALRDGEVPGEQGEKSVPLLQQRKVRGRKRQRGLQAVVDMRSRQGPQKEYGELHL